MSINFNQDDEEIPEGLNPAGVPMDQMNEIPKWARDKFGHPQAPIIDLTTGSSKLGDFRKIETYGMDFLADFQIE